MTGAPPAAILRPFCRGKRVSMAALKPIHGCVEDEEGCQTRYLAGSCGRQPRTVPLGTRSFAADPATVREVIAHVLREPAWLPGPARLRALPGGRYELRDAAGADLLEPLEHPENGFRFNLADEPEGGVEEWALAPGPGGVGCTVAVTAHLEVWSAGRCFLGCQTGSLPGRAGRVRAFLEGVASLLVPALPD